MTESERFLVCPACEYVETAREQTACPACDSERAYLSATTALPDATSEAYVKLDERTAEEADEW